MDSESFKLLGMIKQISGFRLTRLTGFFLTALAVVSGSVTASDDSESPQGGGDQKISFNQDIRPILSDYCYACHGPDEAGRQAGLRLDVRDDAVEYGAIDVDDVEYSSILMRIAETDEDMVMPPPHTGKKVSEAHAALLRKWIEQGAEYEDHWSFEPVPERVELPDAGPLAGWATTPIDQFVAAKILAKDYSPTDEAPRNLWLRRVTFDLTGLPPTLEELKAFEADQSDDALETVVDRLLNSPAYGERMANMWLDVARYADTFGYQNDIAMEVWPWRDWVINAFNDNLPYDEFVRKQTAGDLLPDATVQDRLATTFNRLHRQTNEGGSIPEEFRVANVIDRTSTNATAFLGLTFECARCHDHKFDPILQEDFYRLSSFYSNIDELGLYSHFTFSAPTPAMPLYVDDQESRHKDAQLRVQQLAQQHAGVVEQKIAEISRGEIELATELPDAPEPELRDELNAGVEGVVGEAFASDGDEAHVVENAPEFGRTDPMSIAIWVRPKEHGKRMVVAHQSVAAEDAAFRGLQLVIEDGHPEFSLIHFWPGDAIRVRSKESIPVDQWSHIAVTYDGLSRADGIGLFVDGVRQEVDVDRDTLTRDIKHRTDWGDLKTGEVKFELGARHRDIGFRGGRLDDLQLFRRRISDAEVLAVYQQASASQTGASQTGASENAGGGGMTDEMRLDHYLVTVDDDVREAREALLAAAAEENELYSGVRMIMTMQEMETPRQNFILNRGEYDNRGDEVTPGAPSFLSEDPDAVTNRLELAEWLVSKDNPLTSRVIANRMWHLFFGRGIVASLEDFGSQGSPPTHPLLLDHLARSLMDDGWDLKNLCRRIVLSKTYRQSSVPADPAMFEQDPENVWLARGPKHRLSAEQVRDAALVASGLLVPEIGGPSVMPYQPAGLWQEAGTGKAYKQSTGDGLYRRSLYTFWKRTAPPPSMITFDATTRETCTPRRELTTTPLQALVLLNDPQYVEASRVLAERVTGAHPDDIDARFDEAMRRLISRAPTDAERTVIGQLYDEQLTYFTDDPSRATEFLQVGERKVDESLDPIDLAATSVVMETLVAYDETMMKR